MPAIARLGDTSNHGGTIITASSNNLKANGIAVAVDQDLHSCPIPSHGITPITGTSTVMSGGKKVLRVGDLAGCGAAISNASSNVNINA